MTKDKKRGYIYLEFMRVLAVFFVIFNHTGDTGYFLFSLRPPGALPFWIYMVCSIICKCAVPIFWAISGALLLAKQEPLQKIWLKRIPKMVFLMIVYSLLYYLYRTYNNGTPFDAGYFWKTLYSNNLRIHLWYLYAYIAFLVSLPFLRAIVRNLETKYYYYMIAIALIYNGVIPIIEYLCGHGETILNGYLKPSWMLSNMVVYPCLGYYMQNKVNILKQKKMLPLLWIANIAGLGVSCYMTYYRGQITGTYVGDGSETFHNSFIIIGCIAVFLTVKYIFCNFRIPEFINKIIGSMGKCTLGIYLLHLFLRDAPFLEKMRNQMIGMGFNCMAAALIWCLCVFLICYFVCFILIKIPLLKKLVGG